MLPSGPSVAGLKQMGQPSVAAGVVPGAALKKAPLSSASHSSRAGPSKPMLKRGGELGLGFPNPALLPPHELIVSMSSLPSWLLSDASSNSSSKSVYEIVPSHSAAVRAAVAADEVVAVATPVIVQAEVRLKVA